MSSRRTSKGKAPDVLSAAYLERTGNNKNELLRRLTAVTETLSSLSEDLDPTSHPGLLSLSTALVSPSIIGHRDKDVRLHAVLAACELFYIFAPEPPWEESEIIEIFGQLIRQLGNLHATSPGGSNFEAYFRILEQLSEVKIGVVLVDLVRTERGGGAGGGEEGGSDALETLCELLRTLLNCVHVDHPPEVAAHAELAVSACIEEFEGSVPIPVLEEVLTCVGSGPVVWVTNPTFAALKKKTPGSSARKGRGEKGEKKAEEQQQIPPPQIQQTNPSYLVAAKVLRRTEDKISSPIAALLNGLLTGDPNVVERTSLSTVDAEAAALLSPKGGSGKKRRKNGEKEESPTLATHTLATHLTSREAQNGTNVYGISYELHRIAPQILTTVIGTVSTSLVNQDLTKRWQATKLLGRLFGARTSDIAGRFGPCFREWLRRSYDPEPRVRETMVKCLVNFLMTQFSETDLCADVNEALATIIVRDPTLDIRLLGIHQVCDLAHTASPGSSGKGTVASEATKVVEESNGQKKRPQHPISVVSPELLHAVGNRVSSKNKTEHKDAITGLAQIYFKHYLRKKMALVQEGGEDVAIDEILEVWHQTKLNGSKEGTKEGREEEDKFAWIPQRVFECVSFQDCMDFEMRNRIFQIVDDVLLGSAKKDSTGSGSTLTPTSRAVGLALIVASVKEKDNAYKWMCALFTQRSRLQHALGAYLDARSRAKECVSGSANAFTADNEAVEKLELVASLSAPLQESATNGSNGGSGGKSPGVTDLKSILKKVHSAKDKHIFRILSTICMPSHSPAARVRAFDELPKRTKSLGSAAQSWVKTLSRRCAMGAFLNAESIEHCTMLAQECFEAEDCEASAGFLECVKLGTSVFPSLGSTEVCFKNLVEFFDHSRTSSLSSLQKKDMEKFGLVTSLSEILARSGKAKSAVGPSRPSSGSKKKRKDEFELDSDDEKKSSYDTLREQLLRLCTRDGTPEQARNSVFTIASMIQPPLQQSTPGAVSIASASSIASRVRKERKEFEPLLKALVNPARLSIPDDTTSPKMRGRIVSILSAIAAIAECAPHAFNAEGEDQKLGWGQRAVKFCLDSVLLGKDTRVNASMTQDVESSDGNEEDEDLSPEKGKSPKNSKCSKKGKNNEVSVHCQMLCGAIEVLVSHIRSTIANGQRVSQDSEAPKLEAPSCDHLTEVFDTLVQIMNDGGVPPSSVNGRYCKTSKDKAELRRSAAVNLLRLCDANLRLEVTYMSPKMWHVLSTVLLDSDKSVRSSFMEELVGMFTSAGKFRAHGVSQLAPSLRFLSLVTLCADGEHGAHSAANAGAANVGTRLSNSAKSAASVCIHNLRSACQTARAQCRTQGRSSEKNFESQWKRRLMPEYCVPYALHLLAFREETASAAGTLPGEDESKDEEAAEDEAKEDDLGVVHSQEASQKMLKKRLKWLFDPLIQSLGAGADNISFLLRMVELIGKHPPINVLKIPTIIGEMSSLDLSPDEEDGTGKRHDVDEKEAAARMKIICQFAREVLLSHVKKDVNLTVYPGSIQIPGDLYAPRKSVTPVKAQAYESDEEKVEKRGGKRKPKKSISHYVKKSKKKRNEISRDERLVEDKHSDKDKSEHHKSVDNKAKSEKTLKSNEKSVNDDLNVSGDTYEHSVEQHEDDENSPEKCKAGKSSKKYVTSPKDLNLSGDTYDHSPSFSLSAAVSPHRSDAEEFDEGLGNVSPIAKADSPVAVDNGAPRGRRKRASAQSKSPLPTKSKATEGGMKEKSRAKSPVPMKGNSSSNVQRKKRKSSEIEAFEESTSPVTTDDSTGSSVLPSKSPKRGISSRVSKKPNLTPKRSSTNKKLKATPVSVPKTVMVNVTNSTSSSSRSVAGASSQKKKFTKRNAQKKAAVEEEDFDFSGDFSDDFPDLPVKQKPAKQKPNPKMKTPKKPAKSASALLDMRAASASKARTPAKVKLSHKTLASKAKTSSTKAKASAKTPAGKKVASARKVRSPVKAKVSAKTSAGKSKTTPAKAKALSKVVTVKKAKATEGKFKAHSGKSAEMASQVKASPSTTSEASSGVSPLRRSVRRSARATSRA